MPLPYERTVEGEGNIMFSLDLNGILNRVSVTGMTGSFIKIILEKATDVLILAGTGPK